MEGKDVYMLRVSCMTYNQSAYITDTMNGFVMQQTDFPFVCTIVDDASTDGEQEVIREYVSENFDLQDVSLAYVKDADYGQVIFAKHKVNDNCFFAIILLKENHYSQRKSKAPYLTEWMDTKYLAICEGDDYWINPQKLQRQVKFLEEHEEYSMCFHRAKVLLEIDHPVWLRCFDIENRDYSATELFANWIVPTASMVYRKQVLDYQVKGAERLIYGDMVLIQKCAHTGKVRGIAEPYSVYRIQNSGITYEDVRYAGKVMGLPAHNECIKENFPLIDQDLIGKAIAQNYCSRAMAYWHAGKRKLARSDFRAARKYCPGALRRLVVKRIKRDIRRIIDRILG